MKAYALTSPEAGSRACPCPTSAPKAGQPGQLVATKEQSDDSTVKIQGQGGVVMQKSRRMRNPGSTTSVPRTDGGVLYSTTRIQASMTEWGGTKV